MQEQQVSIEKKISDLTAVLEIARAMEATTDLDALLRLVLAEAIRILDADRASLFLYDPQTEQLYSKIASGEKEIRFSIHKGIAGAAARTRQIINIPDAYADPRFNPEIDRQTGYRTCNILAIPLVDYDDQLVGVLQVLNKRNGCFTQYDQFLADTLGAQAGVALQRARLIEHYTEKLRLERDLDIARAIQRDFLPHESPHVPGFDIAGWNQPADRTGGDCFDFLPLPQNRLAITLGDATGHGIGPALVSAEVRALLRAAALSSPQVEKVMSLVNDLLVHDLADNRFVTLFFGILNAEQARLEYCSGGQGPLLVVRADGRCERLNATAIPLGIMPALQFEPAEPLHFQAGDILALLTDGFFEWTNETGEQFGPERVLEVISSHRHRRAGEIITAIHQAVLEFGEARQRDDLTIVLVKRISS